MRSSSFWMSRCLIKLLWSIETQEPITQWCSIVSQKNKGIYAHHSQWNNNFVESETLRKWSKHRKLSHPSRILNKILFVLCIRWHRLFLWAFLTFDLKTRLHLVGTINPIHWSKKCMEWTTLKYDKFDKYDKYLINPKPSRLAYFKIMKENYIIYTNKCT